MRWMMVVLLAVFVASPVFARDSLERCLDDVQDAYEDRVKDECRKAGHYGSIKFCEGEIPAQTLLALQEWKLSAEKSCYLRN